MLISTFAFACMNATVKHLEGISAYQIVFFRALGSLVFTFWFLRQHKISMKGTHHTLLILRGVVGVSSMLLFFSAIKYVAVGTAISLRYLAPVFAAVFAVFVLKERIKPIQWLFFCIAFTGVLVLKGVDGALDNYGLVLVLISALLSGLVYIIISKIGQREHPLVIVNYFMVIATVTGGLMSIQVWVTPVGLEWLFLALLGVFGYVGQIFMTRAFQMASTHQVAPMKYVEVVFTMTLGVCFFDEVYTLWSLLGIGLIVIGLLLNIAHKQKQQNQTELLK